MRNLELLSSVEVLLQFLCSDDCADEPDDVREVSFQGHSYGMKKQIIMLSKLDLNSLLLTFVAPR